MVLVWDGVRLLDVLSFCPPLPPLSLQHAMCKQQNLPLPKMERHEDRPSPLPNGPTLSTPSLASLERHRSTPPRTEGAVSSNEVTTPSHVTVTSSDEVAGKCDSKVHSTLDFKRRGDNSPTVEPPGGTNLEELRKLLRDSSQYIQLLVEEEEEAVCVDSETVSRLLQEFEIELEKIDQECLELGPFAKDPKTGIREIDQLVNLRSDSPKLAQSSPSQSSRRNRRARVKKEAKANSKEAKSPSVQLDEKTDASLAAAAERVGPESEKPAEEGQKRKWKKVGSGGKQSQAADSAPREDILSLGSGVIPAASEIEMLSLYFPSQRDSLTDSPSPSDVQPTGSIPSSTSDSQNLLSPRQLALDSNLSQSSSSLLSEQDQGESEKAETQRKETLKPQTAKLSPATSLSASTVNRTDTAFIIASSPSAQPLPPVLQIGGYSSSESSPLAIQHVERTASHKPHKHVSRTGIPDSRPESQDKEPDLHNVIAVPNTLVATRPPSVPKTGFSIIHLTSDTESTGSPAPEEHTSEQSKGGWIQERLTHSPSLASNYGDAESPLLNSLKKRRTSSSSSHRSLKQQSLDDGRQPGSPYSMVRPPWAHSASVVFHADAESGGSAASPSPFQPGQEGKPPGMSQPLPGVSMSGVNPYLWANPSQIPSDSTGTSSLPRYPYPSPFLHSNWLQSRGPVLGSLHPFRSAAVFPGLDPNSPYKQMFGTPYLPYRYPFPPQGLKSPFPGGAFPGAVSSANSQPPTPSGPGGFSFSQPSLYPLPVSSANPNLSAFRSLNDISNRSGVTTPPILQHPPFGGKDGKQQPTAANESASMPDKLPPMGWMQPALLGANYGGMSYFGATPFNLGMQKQMAVVQGSISQASPMNIFNARLNSSPFAVAHQNNPGVPIESRSAERPPREQYDRKPLQRKSSAPNIDLTGQREPVGKYPEREPNSSLPFNPEATKLAQVMYGTDVQTMEPSKWKPLQEASQGAASASPIVMPPFVRAPNFPAASSALPFPIVCSAGLVDSRSHLMPHVIPQSSHVIPNNPQLAGHMMPPVGYATPPYTLPASRSRQDSSSSGKASPKNSNVEKKFRIHQVKNDDFKSQTKSNVKKRRRQWRGREKEKEGELVDLRKSSQRLRRVVGDDGKINDAPTTEAAVPASSLPSDSQAEMANLENYGLNILAACSSIQSKEHQKVSVDPRASKGHAPKSIIFQEGDKSQHPHLPSPVSLAGANMLLLLGKDAHLQPTTSTAAPHTVPVRVTAAESTVVDSLLELQASQPTVKQTPSAMCQPQSAVEQESQEVGERSTRSASYSAAEAMLMFSQDLTKSGSFREDASGGSSSGRHEELEVFENLKSGKQPGVQQLRSLKSFQAIDSTPSAELADRLEKPGSPATDSEATDTAAGSDSEATLSPDSPGMRSLGSGPVDEGPKEEEKAPQSERSLTEAPPTQPEPEPELSPVQSPAQEAGTEGAQTFTSPKISPAETVSTEKESSLEAPNREDEDTTEAIPFEELSHPSVGEPGTSTEQADTQREERGNEPASDLCDGLGPASADVENFQESEAPAESDTQEPTAAVESEGEDRLLGAALPSPPQVSPAEDVGGRASNVESVCGTETEASNAALQYGDPPVFVTQTSQLQDGEPEPKSHSPHPDPVPELEPEPEVQPMEPHCSPVASPAGEPPQQDSKMDTEENIGARHTPQEPNREVDETKTQSENEVSEDEPPLSKRSKVSPPEAPVPSQDPDSPPTTPLANSTQAAGAASTGLLDMGKTLPDFQDISSVSSMGTPEGAWDKNEGTQGDGEIEPTLPPNLEIVNISLDDSEAHENESLDNQGMEEGKIKEPTAEGVSSSEPIVSPTAPTASPTKEESPSADPAKENLPPASENSPVVVFPTHAEPESETKDDPTKCLSPSGEFSGEATAAVEAKVPADSVTLQTPASSNPNPIPTKRFPHTIPRKSLSPAPVSQPSSAVDKDHAPSATETAKKSRLAPREDRQQPDRKTPPVQDSSTGGGDLPPKSSLPAPPQNRLAISKSGFDRYQHRKQLMKQGRDPKREDWGQGRKRPKPSAGAQSWGPRGLFEVDPKEIWREKGEKRPLERPPLREELLDERSHPFRKAKPAVSRPHGSGGQQRPPLSERSKYAPHSRPQIPEDPSHRHPRPPQDSRGHSSKLKGHPPSRQGSSGSSPVANHYDQHHPHSPERMAREREGFSPLSDDDRTAHQKYQRQSSEMSYEQHKEKGIPPSKHISHRSGHKHHTGLESHPPLRKQRSPGYEGQQPPRREWKGEKGGPGSQGTSPERRKHRGDAELIGPETTASVGLMESSSKHSRKRRHDEEGRLVATAGRDRDREKERADIRRKSYESISDDEMVFDSSRESSSVRDDRRSSERRSSHDSIPEYWGGVWRKERKRRLSGGESEEEEESLRAPKHKKHSHKSHKEKWRKTEGKDHKAKWSSEEKQRPGNHKH